MFLLMVEREPCKLVFAMDAIFGLPRKKSAGTSFRPPLFKDLFFDDQIAVDQFVQEREIKKSGIVKEVSIICLTDTNYFNNFLRCMIGLQQLYRW